MKDKHNHSSPSPDSKPEFQRSLSIRTVCACY